MTEAAAYGSIARWRYIWSAAVHNCWIIVLPMLVLLSHRNIVGAMVLMVFIGTFFQPHFWPSAARLFNPAQWRGYWQAPAPQAILLVLIGFSAYAFVSVAWAPLKSEWTWALNILLFFLVAAAFLWTMASLPLPYVRFLAWFQLTAVGLAILLVGIEAVTGGGVRDLIPPPGRSDKDIVAAARGTTIAICLFPAFIYLAWRLLAEAGRVSLPVFIGGAGLGLACLVAGSVVFDVSANVAAAAAMIAGSALAWWRPRAAVTVLIGLFAAAFIVAPFVAALLPPVEEITRMEGAPVSWIQRMAIWRNVADAIFAGPLTFLFGGGVNISEAMHDAGVMIQLPGYPLPVPLMPSHPHNLFLQIWLDFGLAGIAVVLLALWLAWRLIIRLEQAGSFKPLIVVVSAMTASYFVFCAVDLSLWTPWRLAAPVYGLYLVITSNRLLPQKRHHTLRT